ncbi:hypothetical protein BS47DRAFT_17203 [Hydnum rufescens UP504]|uniref:Uncharacterized protein n=1 Tax=Hydnum rufescens UP504 TaxID=1448309 RepID=A0A9P6E2K9_9AGAM|nr:hypothetical protein BS47DRAFT_17203 [Hydnum rufescens UP504]
MTSSKKSLEHVMHFPPRPVVHARAKSVQIPVASPISIPPFVNSRSAADVILRVGKQNSPINSPASSPTRRAFLQGDANVMKREGALSARYDLQSSSSSATPYFPQGRKVLLQIATHASPTPEISGKPQKYVSTPVSLHGPLTARGEPRPAPDVPSHDESPRLPFRTSSDGDIPSIFQTPIAGSSASHEPSLSSSTIDVPSGRNNQPPLFPIRGSTFISGDDSRQRITQSPASPPLLANNMATNSPSSPATNRTSTVQTSQFNSFPSGPSVISTSSSTHLNPRFLWGTPPTSNTSSSVVPSQGEGQKDVTGPSTALLALQLGSKIDMDSDSSSSSASTTSGSSEQSSSVSSPTASAGLPLGMRLEELSSDADTRASASISACPGGEYKDDTEMGTLRTFIDQFCFFTGSDADLASHRSPSVSDMSQVTSGGSTPTPSHYSGDKLP